MQHLSERRELAFGPSIRTRTPLLVPSFSSKVREIDKPFRASEEFLDGPFLISAFDLKFGYISRPYDFSGPIFLDSGGYEISRDSDLSDVDYRDGNSKDWKESDHEAVLSNWSSEVPTVIISYDHPRVRIPIREQVERAMALKLPRENSLREILLKPETKEQEFLNIERIQLHVRDLATFGAIGVTEKEVGNSIFDRMLNIARLRRALTKVGITVPIHVFGSLDSTTTLFYFVAGADVFDGLTWLRYAFKDGRTYYRQDFGVAEFGVNPKAPAVEALCWPRNYQYMTEMQGGMRRFLSSRDYADLGRHGDKVRDAINNVEEELGA
jgi:hypothetical protein